MDAAVADVLDDGEVAVGLLIQEIGRSLEQLLARGAAATAGILSAGAQPCLFTDLRNPTSNSIYQRIGYRAVTDCVELAFEQPHLVTPRT